MSASGSDHTTTRLETTGGDVVAYLAPEAVVRPDIKRDLSTNNKASQLAAPVVGDTLTVTSEPRVTSVLEHSDNLPADHRDALETVFGSLPVTPRDQVRRIRYHMADASKGGPFNFYHQGESYDTPPDGTIDWQTSFPQVQISQFRTRARGGVETTRMEVTLVLTVGWTN